MLGGGSRAGSVDLERERVLDGEMVGGGEGREHTSFRWLSERTERRHSRLGRSGAGAGVESFGEDTHFDGL